MSDRKRLKVARGVSYRVLANGSKSFSIWHHGRWVPAGFSEEAAIARKNVLNQVRLIAKPKAIDRSKAQAGGVYFVQPIDGGPVKIGYTTKPPEERLKELQIGSPVTLRVITWLPGQSMELERELHRALGFWRLHGEWFESSRELHELRTFCESSLRLPRGLARSDENGLVEPEIAA